MIQIRTPNIENIANQFFYKINPINNENGVLYKNVKFDKEKSVIGKIKNQIDKIDNKYEDLKEFYKSVLNVDLYKLFCGKSNELNEINKILYKEIEKFKDKKISIKKGKKNIIITYCNHILNTFGYKEFRSSDNAYWFAENLNVKVCPYCNREYTFRFPIYKSEKQNNKLKFKTDKKILFDFDHFLPKEKYPYLSMSFYNLIPSCSICNSRFKHTIEFDYENYIYPYNENFENEIKFKIKLKRKDNLLLDYFITEYQGFMKNKVTVKNENKLENIEEYENLMNEKTEEWIELKKNFFEKKELN